MRRPEHSLIDNTALVTSGLRMASIHGTTAARPSRTGLPSYAPARIRAGHGTTSRRRPSRPQTHEQRIQSVQAKLALRHPKMNVSAGQRPAKVGRVGLESEQWSALPARWDTTARLAREWNRAASSQVSHRPEWIRSPETVSATAAHGPSDGDPNESKFSRRTDRGGATASLPMPGKYSRQSGHHSWRGELSRPEMGAEIARCVHECPTTRTRRRSLDRPSAPNPR
jgi:hypothetical protein